MIDFQPLKTIRIIPVGYFLVTCLTVLGPQTLVNAQTPILQKCTPVSTDEALQNAQTSFRSKFSKISTDIAGQSRTNILQLHTWADQRRPGFRKYLMRAREKVQEIDEQLILTHQTSSKTALSIIRSGYIKSLDELIREGILQAGQKLNSTTKFQYDAQIGEQDVVFLALSNPKLNPPAFGNITFQFNKNAILQKGYMTPYAFGVGSPLSWGAMRSPLCSEEIDRIRPTIERNIPLYKSFLISGADDYFKWIQFSIAQTMWENDQATLSKWKTFFSKRRQQAKEHASLCEGISPFKDGRGSFPGDPVWWRYMLCRTEGTPIEYFRLLISLFGQDFPSGISQDDLFPYLDILGDKPESITMPAISLPLENKELDQYILGYPDVENPILAKILAAHRGFPRPLDNLMLFHSWFVRFWEVKVPVKVSLEDLEVVHINEEDSQLRETIVEALVLLGKSMGKEVSKKEMGNVVTVRLVR